MFKSLLPTTNYCDHPGLFLYLNMGLKSTWIVNNSGKLEKTSALFLGYLLTCIISRYFPMICLCLIESSSDKRSNDNEQVFWTLMTETVWDIAFIFSCPKSVSIFPWCAWEHLDTNSQRPILIKYRKILNSKKPGLQVFLETYKHF